MKMINNESLVAVREKERERESYTLLNKKHSLDNICKNIDSDKAWENQVFVAILFVVN